MHYQNKSDSLASLDAEYEQTEACVQYVCLPCSGPCDSCSSPVPETPEVLLLPVTTHTPSPRTCSSHESTRLKHY